MAGSGLNQVVLDAFRRVSGDAAAGGDIQAVIQGLAAQSGEGFSAALTAASRQIDALRSANQALAEVVQNNTQAVTQNSAAQTNGGKGVAGTIGSVASTIFGSGLGLAPLVASIAHLFGGSKSEAPPTLIPYAAPTPLRLDLADAAQGNAGIQGFSPLIYGQNGLPRIAREDGRAPAPAQAAGPQISIQVNALDSRSFMDHSNEIAQAVRQAMLNKIGRASCRERVSYSV